MSNTILKIVGWVLLSAGVLTIIGTLYSSYNIFTGKADVPEIFEMPVGESSVVQKGETPANLGDIQKELKNMLGQQLKELLPTDTLPKILNLTIWSMLAGLLIFGGGQISGIGIKLLKA